MRWVSGYSQRGWGPGEFLSRVLDDRRASRSDNTLGLSLGNLASMGTTFELWLARNTVPLRSRAETSA